MRRSVDPADYQDVPRAVVAMSRSYPDGHRTGAHRHPRAQLLFALSGTMSIWTADAAWIVPPDRALWMPAGRLHEVRMNGIVDMRTLYVRQDAPGALAGRCALLVATPLLRELIVRATELPVDYDESGSAGAIMRLILDELSDLQPVELALPLPINDAELARLCAAMTEPGRAASASRLIEPVGAVAGRMHISERTLQRRFRRATGLSFGRWRQRARVLEAVRRLRAGSSVSVVAADLGYDSLSAFTTMFRRDTGLPPRRFIGVRAALLPSRR